jgi:hypothetical protein
MKDKLFPVGLNELLCRPIIVPFNRRSKLLRSVSFNSASVLMRSGITPELTRREALRAASKFSMKDWLNPVRLNELLGRPLD